MERKQVFAKVQYGYDYIYDYESEIPNYDKVINRLSEKLPWFPYLYEHTKISKGLFELEDRYEITSQFLKDKRTFFRPTVDEKIRKNG